MPFITRARRLPVLEAAPAPTRWPSVTLADGRVDTVVSCEAPGRVRLAGGLELEGAYGFLSRRDGTVEYAKLMEGTLLAWDDFRLTAARAAYTGTITRVLADDPNDQQLELSAPLPEGQAGRTLIVKNDGEQDAAYTLAAPPRGRRVSLGAISLVRGYVDPNDHAKGFRYNVSPGGAYKVPTYTSIDRAPARSRRSKGGGLCAASLLLRWMPAGQHPVPAPFDGRVIVEAERRHARLRLEASLARRGASIDRAAGGPGDPGRCLEFALQQPAELTYRPQASRVGKRQDFLVR